MVVATGSYSVGRRFKSRSRYHCFKYLSSLTVRRVTVNDFYIGSNPVLGALFVAQMVRAFACEAKGCEFKSRQTTHRKRCGLGDRHRLLNGWSCKAWGSNPPFSA